MTCKHPILEVTDFVNYKMRCRTCKRMIDLDDLIKRVDQNLIDLVKLRESRTTTGR